MHEEEPHVTTPPWTTGTVVSSTRPEEILLHDIGFRQWQLSDQTEVNNWPLWRHHSEAKKFADRPSDEFEFKSFSDRGSWFVRDEGSR